MGVPEGKIWSPERAEEAITALSGVLSARLNEDDQGVIREIHVLATSQLPARRIVTDIESALRESFGRSIDRRKISIAQTRELDLRDRLEVSGVSETPQPAQPAPRIILVGHHLARDRSRRVDVRVELDWMGQRFQGNATGADVAQTRLEALARATLRAVEAAAAAQVRTGFTKSAALHLEGVSVVDGFKTPSVLVSVTAVSGRETTPLAGAVGIDSSTNRAAILATLQATDRWIRGQGGS